MQILSFTVSDDQIQYAKNAVERCQNYAWSGTSGKGDRAHSLRFLGFLGEVVFADAYGLARPANAYGLNGVDNGVDFTLNGVKIDVKTIKLSRTPERGKHVIYMIHAAPVMRVDCETNYFFCVGLLEDANGGYTAFFFGSVEAKCLRAGGVGRLCSVGDVVDLGHKKIEMPSNSFVFNIEHIKPLKINQSFYDLPNAKTPIID